MIQAEFPLIRFHELRHSHASLLHAAETDLKTISERLGHASIGITADVYTHLLAKPQQDAAARIDGLLGHGNAGA